MLALLTSSEFCIARRAKSFGWSDDLAVQLLGQLRSPTTISRHFHCSAELRLVGLVELLIAHRELVGGQLAQGQCRPKNVALVLFAR